MSLGHSLQKGVADFTFIIGAGLKYGGGFALFSMAVVGTISIDLVILAYAQKNRNGFLTGFVCGTMFSPRSLNDSLGLLAISPITSGIAVALSFALGVPGVGVGILIGWFVAAALFSIGLGLEALAESLQPLPELPPAYAPSM